MLTLFGRTTSFWKTYSSSWILFAILISVTLIFSPYRFIPFFGIIGYSLLVLSLLYCFTQCKEQVHYIVLSFTLIILGAAASFDMIVSSEKLFLYWQSSELPTLDRSQFNRFLESLIFLLNIFTGSLAANGLFHGLNKKHLK